ncbi:hypothetical protein EDC39_106152 [Geothermobacter ehrlichii]|uniref:Uncharacterized protein n=1 Tax=Geothermobacter ehrlichii TaxID=213224 RepID=A0A5D3WMI2_9BACT|nr:hypothetical protein [Geothermobacter ehrlichii]TYO98548.1 hypothetical protein EDC39_106152 [Geothermobacter ehrlichii]
MPRPIPPELSNRLCRRCLRSCRQPEHVLLLECPRFVRRPFDSPSYSFRQLELFGDEEE